MILPIHVYGAPILRTKTRPVEGNGDDLQRLIGDMIETMRGAEGIGLAAPQVGRTERLFVVDLGPLAQELAESGELAPDQPVVFINPEIVDWSESKVEFEEGCLSIPEVREYVDRPDTVRVRYRDRDWSESEMHATGMLARVIQHELDHLDGVLFVDRISPFRRRLLRRRLKDIMGGVVDAEYPVALPA